MLKNLLTTFFILLLISLNCTAQENTIDQWKSIDSDIDHGLTKTALSKVNKIYTLSNNKGNQPELIRCLLYIVSLNDNLSENTTAKNIFKTDSIAATKNGAAKAILLSIEAEMYWNFLRQNRYKFYNRTNTLNFNKTDINTWTINDLNKKIDQLYQHSLIDKSLLQKIDLQEYQPILIKGNTRSLRPTLYDFLAHRALDFFKDGEADISRPVYSFQLNDPKAFLAAKEFINTNFVQQDSIAHQYKALLLLQDLLKFHLNDKQADALIEVDIERLQFVFRYSTLISKTDLYINALTKINSEHKNDPFSAQALFLAAQEILNKGLSQKGIDSSKSNYTIAAKSILEQIILLYPKSEGAINAENLLNDILRKSLKLTTEKVNIPSESFRALVTYTNISKIYFRIIKSDNNLKNDGRDIDDDQLWKLLTHATPLRSWGQNLPLPADYQTHSAEIKIDALNVGDYYLLASESEDFIARKSILSADHFLVSNISFITNKNEVFVLHRKTGEPLANAKVIPIPSRYNNTITVDSTNAFLTDKNGYTKLVVNNQNPFVSLDISYQGDHLSSDHYQNIQNFDPDKIQGLNKKDSLKYEYENSRFFLFTDRSIYRPGQLVYFKAIGVTKSMNSSSSKLIVTRDSITVLLHDANGQAIDSLKLMLNDYGSIHGSFKLPDHLMNGYFAIIIKYFHVFNTTFSVEEYKRPTFYAVINKPGQQLHLSDDISISGSAKAYAGNTIQNAVVKYHITRVTRILYDWMWRYSVRPNTPIQEIASGITTTGMDGSFNFHFNAFPDPLIDSNLNPSFNFKIDVDVTDINGETKSTSLTIPLGYTSTILSIELKNEQTFIADSLKKIFIKATNLSGEETIALAALRIYKLQSPDRLIRKRYWEAPDQFTMSREAYIQNFPNDEYNKESDLANWPKEKLSFQITDSANKPYLIPHELLEDGWYAAEAETTESNGRVVKDIKYFQVLSLFHKQNLIVPQYCVSYFNNNSIQPGKKIEIITGSSARNVFLVQQILKPSNRTLAAFEFANLDNDTKKTEITITDNDRGNIQINEFFVKENRIYNNHYDVYVPWNNKQLKIEFETYRDKTAPGSDEDWKLKIKGEGSEKVSAEMVATMYDASLDQFRKHFWAPLEVSDQLLPYYKWDANGNFNFISSFQNYLPPAYISTIQKAYDELVMLPHIRSYRSGGVLNKIMSNAPMNEVIVSGLGIERQKKELSTDTDSYQLPSNPSNDIKNIQDPNQINIRKNFNETAFFLPELKTDANGNIEFQFKMPEALTQWKLMTLAHTKDLSSGYAEKLLITQKELMVQPNIPRFLRQGDRVILSTKVVNLHATGVSGMISLQLLDAVTLLPVDFIFNNTNSSKPFNIEKARDQLFEFSIQVPADFIHPITYRFIAKSNQFTDGEESIIPVLSNKILVTESLPLYTNGEGKKQYTFNKLLNFKQNSTIRNIALSVEYTSNPIWYVVQALPYIIESKEESSEEIFNRFYANSIASKIINNSPQIKNLFQRWKNNDTGSLKSNLQKNTELKSLLLQETPWVLEAQNETQQKKNIAMLVDNNNINAEKSAMIKKLQQMQLPNGSFPWYKGGQEDIYMTQYILSGLGHLKNLHAITIDNETKTIIAKGLIFLDKKNRERYESLIKNKLNLKHNLLSNEDIQYLYMRSFFLEFKIANDSKKALSFLLDQSGKYWLSTNIYMQGMIALYLHRSGEIQKSSLIIRSLKENAITNDELGMYWKQLTVPGYWWYQAPIESQSLLIEAFSEIDKDSKTVSALQTWLIKNKQVNNWKSTRATADACYALLINGNNLMDENKNVIITLGDKIISSDDSVNNLTKSYLKTSIKTEDIKASMGKITTTVSSNLKTSATPSWGAVYWQYLENADKVTVSETPLQLQKKLFVETITDKGALLSPVTDNTILHIGDKIKVRIELRVDRDMEYIHMRDMRASDLEPVNVISSYKYQDGLGYYESTKDASTDFFFDHLNKGTYVFEYPLFITHKGNYTNGITHIECMYAPEFTAHSEGARIEVK